jgi:PAS domain S-box-containing protein
MRIKIKPEVQIVIILLIPVILWVYFAKHFITKMHINFGPLGNTEDFFETIFIIFTSAMLYFSIKTLRKKIEQSGKEYLQLFKINSVPMWIYDKKTLQFLLVNDAAIKSYGYSRDEFLSMTIKDIRPMEELNRLEADLQQNWVGFKNAGMWKHKKKNGSIIIAQVCADNVMLHKKECRLISAHNVTALFKAKDEIRKGFKKVVANEELMQTAEQLANFGSWEYEIVTENVKFSDGMFRLYGYIPQSVASTFNLFLEHVHPEDLEYVKKVHVEAIRNFASLKFEFRIIDKNGVLKYIRSGLRILRNDQHEPILLRGFNLDITETQLSVERLKQSHQELQALATHLENIREEERTDIAREIHDELGQQLTAIKFDISWVKSKLQQDAAPLSEKITEAIGLVDDTIKSVRKIASKLRPIMLTELGLPAALKWQSKEFEKRTGIPCFFTENFGNYDIDKSVSFTFFRVYQEVLTNITRHSCATRVDSSLLLDHEYLILKIIDNGTGFDQEEVKSKKSLGLIGIKERALSMNAELIIQSMKGKGTTITIKLLCAQTSKTENIEVTT